jgi:hypothetical protein
MVAIQSGAAMRPAAAETATAESVATADGSSFGVALGFPVAPEDGEVQWQGLMAKVGTLLIGLWPVLADVEGSTGQIVIAGPVASETEAAELCGRLDRVGIPCRPVPFKGDPLPMLN